MAFVRCQMYLFIGLILFIATGIVGTILWKYYVSGKPSLITVALSRSSGNVSIVESRKRWSTVTNNKKSLTSLVNIRHAVNKSDLKLKQDRITVLFYNEWLTNINRSGFNTNDGTCLYSNCYFTHNISLFDESTAVIFYARGAFTNAPPVKKQGQVWIFSTMESPLHHGSQWRHLNWRNKVNWTSNYRLDSDILAAYGFLQNATQPKMRNYQNLIQRKTSFVAWIVSNCETPSGRDKYVAELQQYIPVDIYGDCGKPLLKDRRETIENYMFYLAFENSLCLDYITEKFFSYYQYDTVLVTRGGAEYDRILPHDTFINTARYSSVKELGEYLLYLSKNKTAYLMFLKNRDKYDIYEYDPYDYGCNVCEKLNNVDKYRNLYTDFEDLWTIGQCWLLDDYTKTEEREIEVSFKVFVCVVILLGIILRNLWHWFRKRTLTLRSRLLS